jgi:beta-N-acetylhexosaminidase
MDEPGPHSDAGRRAISRRDLLRATALGGVAAFLAACSGRPSPDSSGGSTPSPNGSPVPRPSATIAASASRSPAATASPTPSATLRQRIAGLIVVGFRGSALGDAGWVEAALGEPGLGGVILFDRDQLTGRGRNIVSPGQVKTLTTAIRAAAGERPILIGVDQEGGVVTRLSPAHGFPEVSSEAAIGAGSAAAARRWAGALAATLSTAGIDLNFAPVVDLDVNPDSPAIGALGRSFSADPDVVVAMATIEVAAHRAAGVRTTLKHFPGIGSSTANTDFGVADVTRTWSRTELEPFRRLIEADAADLIMAGHVVNGQLDPDRPASLSRATVTTLLRDELGWDGPVVTDDLQAAAITRKFGADEAVLLALEAGNDLLLFANQQVYDPRTVTGVVSVIERAVTAGRIPETRIDEAYARVRRLLGAVVS